jgi:hypothetical protein
MKFYPSRNELPRLSNDIAKLFYRKRDLLSCGGHKEIVRKWRQMTHLQVIGNTLSLVGRIKLIAKFQRNKTDSRQISVNYKLKVFKFTDMDLSKLLVWGIVYT